MALMARLRSLLLSHRTLAALLVVCALVMKALVPAGYMVGSQARTIAIEICAGQDGSKVRQIDLGLKDHGPGAPGKADGVCPYGALGHSSLAGTDPVLLASALAFVLALAFLPLIPARPARIAHIRPPLRGPPSKARPT